MLWIIQDGGLDAIKAAITYSWRAKGKYFNSQYIYIGSGLEPRYCAITLSFCNFGQNSIAATIEL